MRTPQTPAGQALRSVGKGLKNRPTQNNLNISRKILQKSVCSNNKRIDALQFNNIQLARRVSELQMELSQTNTELQACKAEVFQHKVMSNRLQNPSSDVSLYALRDILSSGIEVIYKALQMATKVCNEISAGHADASTVTGEKSIDMSLCPEPEIAILKGNVQHPHAVGDSSGEDIVCDDDNDKEKNDSKADYLEDNEITLRASARSIEMECDSFSRPSRSLCEPIMVVKPLESVPSCSDVNRFIEDHEIDDLATIVSTEPIPLAQHRKNITSPKKPKKSRSKHKKNLQLKIAVATTNPPTSPHTVYSLDSSNDHYLVEKVVSFSGVASPSGTANGEPNRTNKKRIKKMKRTRTKERKMEEAVEPGSPKSPRIAERLSVDPDASHNVEDDAGRPKMALDELAKNGEITSPKSARPPTRVRRRIKIIADDSVFIPISDSMMIVSDDKLTTTAAAAITENASTTALLKMETASADRIADENTAPVLIEEEDALSPFTTPIRQSGITGVASFGIPPHALGQDEKKRPVSTTSDDGDRKSDASNAAGRVRRKTGPVSYVVKLNTKLRQGNSEWCKH